MLPFGVQSLSSPTTEVYTPRGFILQTASLGQGFPHCPRFPTAASRRSLDRVSVPVWLIILSDQLKLNLGRLLPHQLVNLRRPIPKRFAPFLLRGYGEFYSPLRGMFPRVTHPFATVFFRRKNIVRLACIKSAVSVRSEPGSNSNRIPAAAMAAGSMRRRAQFAL